MLDLLIKNGTIIDGSGAEGFPADLGIRGERVVAIGNLADAAAACVIDAQNHVVAPGFVDPHTHSDFTILQDPYCNSKIRQGVTSEIAGNCGFSLFPLLPEKIAAVKSYVSFMPGSLDWNWGSFKDIAGLLGKTGIAGNFGSLVGHGMARIMAMDFSSETAGRDQLASMSDLLAEALSQGAMGLSLGLAYPPGSYANREELTTLSRVVRCYPHALVTAHLRDEGDGLMESVEEILHVARESGVPVHISHHKATGPANWGKVHQTMEIMAAAAAGGADVTFDVYPYTAGNTTIVSLFPRWSMDKGVEGLMERLVTERSRIAREMEAQAQRVGGWDRIVVATVKTAQNKPYEGKSIAEIAQERAVDGVSAIIDLCASERGAVNVILFYIDDQDVKAVMRHPQSMFGSDGKILKTEGPLSAGKPHPRNFGAFPRILAKYVREEKTLSLPEAIRKMTSLPAARFSLDRRGLLKEGYFADITIFDQLTVRDTATFSAPQQYPVGIPHVIVNGVAVIEGGELTGALPGKVLLRSS
jgi:N-acyl-D-amino-acid deacylase